MSPLHPPPSQKDLLPSHPILSPALLPAERLTGAASTGLVVVQLSKCQKAAQLDVRGARGDKRVAVFLCTGRGGAWLWELSVWGSRECLLVLSLRLSPSLSISLSLSASLCQSLSVSLSLSLSLSASLFLSPPPPHLLTPSFVSYLNFATDRIFGGGVYGCASDE